MRGKQTRQEFFRMRGNQMDILGRSIGLPANRGWRIAIGVAFVMFGLVGFLPILGFWMVPLGLLILSADLALVRRWRRRTGVRWGRWRQTKRANAASFTAPAAEERRYLPAGDAASRHDGDMQTPGGEGRLEASAGIEPACKDLQSSA